MAKEYAQPFYNSTAWKKCREAYKHKVGYLCENCLRHGDYKAGDIVHHIIEINPININDPNVTLNFDNLELLCRDCHAKVHDISGGRWAKVNQQKRERREETNRYTIGPDGTVTAKND